MDPIAVDYPVKAPPPPASRVAIPPVRVETPRTVPPTAASPTNPPAAAGQTGWPKKAASALGFGLTKRQVGLTAAAALSLIAGVFAVRTFGPEQRAPESAPDTKMLAALDADSKESTRPDNNPPQPPDPLTTRSEPSLPEPAVEPVPTPGHSGIPVVSVEPLLTSEPPASVAPAMLPPLPSTPLTPELPGTALPPPSDLAPPTLPEPVTPAGGANPLPPAIPELPGLPSATPAPPGTPPDSAPLPLPLPLPGSTPEPPSPAAPTTLPSATPPATSTPLPLPAPTTPEPVVPLPGTPVDPPEVTLPTPLTTPPATEPVMPVTPPDAAPVTPPSTTPVIPTSPPMVLPAPTTAPTEPDNFPPSVAPVIPVSTPNEQPRVEFMKSGEREVKPAGVVERTPTTSFDVDLYEPKAGDSYETISREFYNDLRYTRALAEFNRRKPMQGSGPIEVPPIHILKTRYSSLIGGTPTGTITPSVEWMPASATIPAPVPQPAGRTTFVVPAGGMSMRAVAREALGTDKRWLEIYDLNPQYAPDAVPAGATLKLPANPPAALR